MKLSLFINIFLVSLLLYSCAPNNGNKVMLYKNNIELRGGEFSSTERKAVIQRLFSQLDDSSKVTTKDVFFIPIKKPVRYDSGFSSVSAATMRYSMFHIGYYNSTVSFTADTSKNNHVTVNYVVTAGKPTRIDTFAYRLKKPDLQEIALESKAEGIIIKGNPITKTAVVAEVSRLVDSFRNAGYYKFTAAELRVRGDTTIAALTTVSDDPFEQLQLLNDAQAKRDSPTIKLDIVLNKPDDSTKLNKYTINKIYVLSDFRPSDQLSDTFNLIQRKTRSNSFILRYHEQLFRTGLFSRNITMRSGDIFSQREYYKTLSNLSALGVWQSVNIRILENLDENNKVDLVIELLPGKKMKFDISFEGSYSATSSTNSALGGNLFGFSTNFSLLNRNFAREAIRMTHNLRLGVELNNRLRNNSTNLINSNEVSYSNNVTIPRALLLFKSPKWGIKNTQSFINTSVGYSNRLNLFSLQSVTANYGETGLNKKGNRWTVKLPNVEFNYLFNQSDSFQRILDSNLFLRYSYNTAFILGLSAGYSSIYHNQHHPLSLSKERSFRANFEESNMTLGWLFPVLKKYKNHFAKVDVEYKYTVTKRTTEFAVRGFTGVGIPLAGDASLPFFKQYFGGGSNSMRGWPVRGIGRGSQKLTPFKTNIFNDRTGDIQFEANVEYRHDIAKLIPDLLTLKGAVFMDIGNIWNYKNSNLNTAIPDPAQFQFKNFYRELGMSAGYGFRFDFGYLALRTDFGFRFKRPETSDVNAGWKAPSISFDDAFRKLFGASERQWRYENFNFTIGINKPF